MSDLTLFILALLLATLAVIIWRKRKSPDTVYVEQSDVNHIIASQPNTDQPKIDQLVVDLPKVDRLKVEQPKIDKPKIDKPKIDLPKKDQPKVDQTVMVPEADQKVLDQLRAAGSDMSKLHEMEFYLYFPDPELANLVANRIKAEGFAVEVKKAPHRPAWMCYVTRRMVPDGVRIAIIGKRFTELAEEFDGEYDGWETSLVR
ncbi:MAG: ribonuclease E inhibitor RraB [Acidobacteria bacterium]|nr:ribonuclease E inhibitor RraB [Acidobacteriota bacterium]